jgi:hypothetical protein
MGELDERRAIGQPWSDTRGLQRGGGGGSYRGSNRGGPADMRINATGRHCGGLGLGRGGRQAKARNVAKRQG